VIHAIEAHHGDVDPQTITAVIVQAADAISAARPGARREDLENCIKRLEKIEEIAKGFNGVDKAFAVQAGREIRVMVNPEEINDDGMKLVAREMAQKIQEEVKYPGQIKINLIRESRAVDYAK
jgi:ribonuclease Y